MLNQALGAFLLTDKSFSYFYEVLQATVMWNLRVLGHAVALSSICILLSTFALYSGTVSDAEWSQSPGPFPSDTTDNLFWFVQVSDIHISRYLDPKRAPEFKDFCEHTLGIIQPKLVLVTGDLTDAKRPNRIGSQQFEDEWVTYQSIVRETQVTEKYVWLDIRGNHDAFDVLRVDDPDSNYYIKYSGDKGHRTANVYHHETGFGRYSFIPIDATMIPGPRRPFNFIGYLPKERMNKLEKYAEESYTSNVTIWYSHYPTSSITSSDPGLRTLVGKYGGVYLAGHFHTVRGLVPRMYAMNPNGFLELELGDWMDNRLFRIVAVDHDLLSFSDVKHNDWPAIIITNPKEARFMLPHSEPLGRIKKSSHIRFLVFDPHEIEDIVVTIDGMVSQGTPRRISNTSLWVTRWNSMTYNKGIHTLSITVTDSHKNTKTVSQKFSLDTSWKLDFDSLAVITLVTDFCMLLFNGFYAVTFIYLAAVLFAHFHPLQTNGTCWSKISLLLKNDAMFRGVFLFGLNLLWGPWFIGEIISGNIGVCFSYGLLVNGQLQPENLLYLYGIITTVFFYTPCLAYLAHWNYEKKVKQRASLVPTKLLTGSTLLPVSFLLYLLLHLKWCFELYQAYGLMSALISPSRLWWTCFIMYQTGKLWIGTSARQAT